MSCNGCRVLRKGCGEDCILRQCLGWIGNPQAQANATIFVAKFFGRAGLMSFISSVPRDQRPSLFQSLLFEAVGRTVNPVSGAVGLLWTGNWQVCQTAVVTVLRRGTIEALPEFEGGSVLGGPELDNVSECVTDVGSRPQATRPNGKRPSSSSSSDIDVSKCGLANLDLCLAYRPEKIRRAATPSEESDTTTSKCDSSNICGLDHGAGRRVLRLFV